MPIPGQNLLRKALGVVAKQSFDYHAFAERTLQPNGQYLSSYRPPVAVKGSVQAVPRELYQKYGLEFQNRYMNFFLSADVLDVGRNTSGDMFVFEGKSYQVESITPWHGVDGWVEALAIQVPEPPRVSPCA